MRKLTDKERAEAEAVAASFRAQTGQPIHLPPALHRFLKAGGANMANLTETQKLPVGR